MKINRRNFLITSFVIVSGSIVIASGIIDFSESPKQDINRFNPESSIDDVIYENLWSVPKSIFK